jgi:hypothetical protein
MIKSKKITDHKLLKDVHEKSLQNPRQKQPVPMQQSGRAFEGVWTPRSVLQINIEDVRTSKQHRPDARSISIQQGVYFQKSTLFGKSLQAVRTTWQHVRTMSSSSKYSRVPFECGNVLVFVLAAFCWTKSLLCNVAAFTGILLYPESTFQLCSSRRFCEVFKEVHSSSLSAVRTTWYSIRTLIS